MKVTHIARNIRPGGGPAGYVYNLRALSRARGSTFLDFYGVEESEERAPPTSIEENTFIMRLPKSLRLIAIFLLLIYRDIIDLFIILRMFKSFRNSMIVFHDQNLAYWFSRIYRSPFIVMPHQPCEFSREASEIYARKYGVNGQLIYNYLLRREVYAYQKSIAIMSPTTWSLDGYFPNNRDLQNLVRSKPSISIPSSVTVSPSVIDRNKARQNLSLAPNDKIIGFFGRYIEDKGYDIFLRAAAQCSHDPKIRFISAGAGHLAVNDPTNEQVIDLGWRTDIADIMQACDVVLIPNRITYFDLLPIECITKGIPIAVSPIGGNKFLLGLNSENWIQAFDIEQSDLQEQLNLILNRLPKTGSHVPEVVADMFSPDRFLSLHEEIHLKGEIFNHAGRG